MRDKTVSTLPGSNRRISDNTTTAAATAAATSLRRRMRARMRETGGGVMTSSVHQGSRRRRRRREGEQHDSEMAACFAQLQRLVPALTLRRLRGSKVTKVELLQHVIDYIVDLELTLDYGPAAEAKSPSAHDVSMSTDNGALSRTTATVSRQPLADCTQHNIRVVSDSRTTEKN
jgi:hypothetical protein